MIYDEVMKIHISRFPYNDFLFEYFDNDEEESAEKDHEEQ
jgi:GTP-binding protein HflX